jgi:4'-phosphopantetheinyl transferase
MDNMAEWDALPGDHALPADQVHVWRIGIHWPPERIRGLQRVLSLDEQAKAARFHFAIDRTRYVVGRGVLRQLLARCLELAPDELCFDYNAFGKPSLRGSFSGGQMQFNLSHSGDFVLIAVARGRAVGIDVERIRTDMALNRIAAQFFSPHERTALATLEARQQYEGFFACWTRKEAYIKARGDGLSLPLDQFDVSLLPGEAARLLETRPDSAEARCWILRDLEVGFDYKAALAVQGGGWDLRMWDLPI